MWGQFVGFILLFTGTLVYNEIVIVPVEAMRQNTKAIRAQTTSDYIELTQK